MGNIVEVMEKYIFYKITKDEYPDIKIDKDANITNLIIKEFNKLIDKEEYFFFDNHIHVISFC